VVPRRDRDDGTAEGEGWVRLKVKLPCVSENIHRAQQLRQESSRIDN
jgi:hypothetical protein